MFSPAKITSTHWRVLATIVELYSYFLEYAVEIVIKKYKFMLSFSISYLAKPLTQMQTSIITDMLVVLQATDYHINLSLKLFIYYTIFGHQN